MDVTITNAGGRIEIVDLRNGFTNNYNVLKDNLTLFNLGDIVQIIFANQSRIEIYFNEVELINGGVSIEPKDGTEFLDALNAILGDYGPGGLGTVPTLQQVTDEGNSTTNDISFTNAGLLFDNNSKVKKGTTDMNLGGAKGVALICSIDYELKWEAGRLYILEQDGFTIREVRYTFTTIPNEFDDFTKGFIIGSRWVLDNGNVYTCTDDTTNNAVWVLETLGGGDMFKSVYDTDNDGNVDKAETVQIIVRNSTGATLTKGQIVYLSGATGNRPNAVLSQANSEATSSKTIGWVTANINNNSDGFVAVSGSAHDLDTSAFTAGDALWLSPTVAGGITATKPTQPDHAVFIGYCARSHPNQGRIVFKIQNGFELQELHNVLITSVANDEGLFYESSTSLWKNKTIANVLGYTPVTDARTLSGVKSISGGGDLTANRTFELVNDETSPTARKFYSTNSSAARGWRTIEKLDLPSIILTGALPYIQNEFISFSLASAIIKIPGSNIIFAAYTTTQTVICYDSLTSVILSTTTVAGASGLVYVATTGQVWAFGSAAAVTRFTATAGVSLGSTTVTGLTASCRGVYDDSSVTGNVYAYSGPTMNVINSATYARTGVSIGAGTGTNELVLVTSGAQAGLLVGTVNIGVFGFNKTTNTLAYAPTTAFSSTSIKYIPSLNRILTLSPSLNSIYFFNPATSTTITLASTITGIASPNFIEFDETENLIFVVSGFTGTSTLKLSVFDLTTLLMIKTIPLTAISSSGVNYVAIDKTNKNLYIVGNTNNGSINKIIYA